MPWIESASPRFRARHDTRDTDEAVRVLSLLERTRSRLEELFPREAGEVTVVLHRRPAELVLARPQIGFAWASTAPAARRYVAGHLGASELHVLSAQASTSAPPPCRARARCSRSPLPLCTPGG